MQKIRKKIGQTFVEYSLLLGIVVVFLLTMTPLIKRTAQGMVRAVADQLGNQADADQGGGTAGQLDNLDMRTWVDQEKTTQQYLNVITVTGQERQEILSNQTYNLGFM